MKYQHFSLLYGLLRFHTPVADELDIVLGGKAAAACVEIRNITYQPLVRSILSARHEYSTQTKLYLK